MSTSHAGYFYLDAKTEMCQQKLALNSPSLSALSCVDVLITKQ